MKESYDDIIYLSHHSSNVHPRMSLENRAAQFLPFAALAGFEAAVAETARRTDQRIELGESSLAALDTKLDMLARQLHNQPKVVITYFQPDKRKSGGKYLTIAGVVKKIDNYDQSIWLMSGERIMMNDILTLEGELFLNCKGLLDSI